MTIFVKRFPFHSHYVFQKKLQNISGTWQNIKILDSLSHLNEESVQRPKLRTSFIAALGYPYLDSYANILLLLLFWSSSPWISLYTPGIQQQCPAFWCSVLLGLILAFSKILQLPKVLDTFKLWLEGTLETNSLFYFQSKDTENLGH